MNKKEFARILRLKHIEGDHILLSDKSDAYMRAYAYGITDACNEILKQIGMEPSVTTFEQELIDRRKQEISDILRRSRMEKSA